MVWGSLFTVPSTCVMHTLFFLPQLSPNPVQEWLPANSPAIQNLIVELPFGYSFWTLPLYSDFSDSRQDALEAIPLSYQRPSWHPLGLFSHSERLLLHPEDPNLSMQTVLRHMFPLAVPPSTKHHCFRVTLSYRYSCIKGQRYHAPRSTGILLRREAEWRIFLYNQLLALPIPPV